jgi:hypothetical protein
VSEGCCKSTLHYNTAPVFFGTRPLGSREDVIYNAELYFTGHKHCIIVDFKAVLSGRKKKIPYFPEWKIRDQPGKL